MQDYILISILCVVVGLLAGALLMNKNKINKKENSKKPVTKSKKDKIEFSKLILIVTFAIALVIISFTMVIIYLGTVNGYGADSSNLNTLLGGLFAEVAAGTGFYYWKARRENEIKLRKTYGEDYTKEDNY